MALLSQIATSISGLACPGHHPEGIAVWHSYLPGDNHHQCWNQVGPMATRDPIADG